MVVPASPRRMVAAAAEHEHGAAAKELLERGLPQSDVLEVVLSPRPGTGRPGTGRPGTAAGDKPMTPRPVVRGPKATSERGKELSEEEENAFARAFDKFDKHRCGKLELHSFHEMCESLDLHLDAKVAKEWLGDLNQVDGLAMEDVKEIYCGIMSAQTPAVRKSAAGKALCLSDMRATEDYMRKAFSQWAPKGTLGPDQLRELLVSLGFPDVHGDSFDRFVCEWLLLAGKPEAADEPPLTVHDFISCVNLLVELCQAHQQAQMLGLEPELEV
eukprot:gb/GFBE01017203.1/.p1 GENE.gb/GFBE01017203.1/~~gb/GFBE01017203.1/.p1  ORF type:complete len:272 (+),score=50.93 gb/GFBE01017203.1/:1-816(+)